MLDQLQGLHVETTNMCTLKCPKCARTEFIKQFPRAWKNVNLNLEHFKQFIDINLTGKRIYLCGNYGDAIYYDRLFDLIDYVKGLGAYVELATNGSYRDHHWWLELAQRLTDSDSVIFGIDGTPNNFTKYRVNADWDSVLVGLETISNSTATAVWQYIPFNYNENDIDATKQLAKNIGVDKFVVFPSYRWDGNDDPLKPTITNNKTESRLVWSGSNQIDAECKRTNHEHYISANGFYAPCCYVVDHRFYYKSEFFKNKDMYDISKNTLSQILTRRQSIDFYNSIEDAKLNYCTFNCPKL